MLRLTTTGTGGPTMKPPVAKSPPPAGRKASEVRDSANWVLGGTVGPIKLTMAEGGSLTPAVNYCISSWQRLSDISDCDETQIKCN
jgi:hypothetical protein